MKARNYGFEVKKNTGFVELPPAGVYVGQILDARAEKTYDKTHDQIVMMIDITEGEYAGRYMEQYNDAKDRFPETKYKGTFRIVIPEENEPAEKMWIERNYQNGFWAIQECNPGYAWDWNEKSLKGKKIGFTVRKRFFTYDGKDRETTEIARLDSIKEIKEGKVKLMPVRDNRTATTADEGNSADGTDVTGTVEVPF